MRLDSVVSAIDEHVERARTIPPRAFTQALGVADSPAIRERYERMAPWLGYVPGVTLGIAQGSKRNDYNLSIVATSHAEAEAYAATAPGETTTHIVRRRIRPYPTVRELRQRIRPLVPGLEVAPANFGWVGTAGFFARDGDDGSHLLVSNEHVLRGFVAPLGTPIVSPGRANTSNVIGTLDRFVPRLVNGPANLVDAAAALLDSDGDFEGSWNGAIANTLTGFGDLRPEDLGREVAGLDRSVGVTVGTVRAVGQRGLPVLTSRGEVVFNDQAMIANDAEPFSQPGSSGRAVVLGRRLAALLHAGVRDSRGIDLSWACSIETTCALLNVRPVLRGGVSR